MRFFVDVFHQQWRRNENLVTSKTSDKNLWQFANSHVFTLKKMPFAYYNFREIFQISAKISKTSHGKTVFPSLQIVLITRKSCCN